MQAYSPTLPVGTQRHYTSLLHALRSIYTQDGGLRGLFRGVPTAVVRTSMGTSFQMPSYFWMKHQLQSSGVEGFTVVVASSVFAGAVVVRPNFRLVSTIFFLNSFSSAQRCRPPIPPSLDCVFVVGILRLCTCLTVALVYADTTNRHSGCPMGPPKGLFIPVQSTASSKSSELRALLRYTKACISSTRPDQCSDQRTFHFL